MLIGAINVAGLLLVRAESRRKEIAVRAALGGAPVRALADGSRGSAGRPWSRVGGKLVVIELAFAMVLIAGGVLLARSLYGLLHVDVGMQPDHVAMIGVQVSGSGHTNAELVALQRRVREGLDALPGVESVGTASTRPLQGGNTRWIQVVGRPYHGEHNEVNEREIDDGYFRTIRAHLLRGRAIEATDEPSKTRVAVINQAFVRKYFPGENPVGQRVLYSLSGTRPLEIVGIVDDIRESPLDGSSSGCSPGWRGCWAWSRSGSSWPSQPSRRVTFPRGGRRR